MYNCIFPNRYLITIVWIKILQPLISQKHFGKWPQFLYKQLRAQLSTKPCVVKIKTLTIGMIANQDTLLKSAYMNESYWVVAMNITFNLTVYLKKHNWPLLDHDPSWPLHDLFEPSITLRSSQGFFLPNLVAIGHC